MKVGDRILTLRNSLRLTREIVAHEAGLSDSTLVNYERRTSEPRASDLIALAKILKTTCAYLLGEIDDPSADALKHAVVIDKQKSSGMTDQEIDDAIRSSERHIALYLEQDRLDALKKLKGRS